MISSNIVTVRIRLVGRNGTAHSKCKYVVVRRDRYREAPILISCQVRLLLYVAVVASAEAMATAVVKLTYILQV